MSVPFTYALERLAQRWSVAPWELERPPAGVDPDAHLDWVIRGMEYQRLEGSVKRG